MILFLAAAAVAAPQQPAQPAPEPLVCGRTTRVEDQICAARQQGRTLSPRELEEARARAELYAIPQRFRKPAPAAVSACPDVVTPEAFVCRALEASAAHRSEEAAKAFEQAALATADSDPAASRMWAAAGNMWIAAGEPGKAALALDRALAGSGLRAEDRGEALLDRARAAEAQNDLKAARAKVTEAAQSIAEDPFLWYFSAALAIRELDKATAQSSINRALALLPGDPTILFEAGHVAHFAGDPGRARGYWQRVVSIDPAGPNGKAAREALALLDAPPAKPAPPTR